MSAETDDEFLFDCFVHHPASTTAGNIQSAGMILAGRTGSGKTAIMRFLEHNAEHVAIIDPFEMALSYVANSDVLRFLHQIGADLDLLFQVLWKHVLCIEFIRLRYKINDETHSRSFFAQIFGRFSNDVRRKKSLNYLKDWEGRFWITMDENIKEITQRYESKLEGELGGEISKFKARGQYDKQLSNEKKLELVSRARKIINADQLTELSGVIEMLRSLADEDRMVKYFIMIDKLDERWVDDSVRFRLIRALTEALKAFKAITNLKILIGLRSDILERVAQETTDLGFQWEKYQDYLIRLRWRESELKQLVQKRIRLLFRRQYTTHDITFEDVFPYKVGNVDPFDYLVERTLLRPRDIITFVNECLTRAEGHYEVTARMVKEAEGEYSRIRRQALEQEWQSAFPTLPKLLSLLATRKSILTFSDLADALSEETALEICAEPKYSIDPLSKVGLEFLDNKETGKERFTAEVAAMLYRVGAIGLKLQPNERYLYSHMDAPVISPVVVHGDTRIRVHPMLHRALNVQQA